MGASGLTQTLILMPTHEARKMNRKGKFSSMSVTFCDSKANLKSFSKGTKSLLGPRYHIVMEDIFLGIFLMWPKECSVQDIMSLQPTAL